MSLDPIDCIQYVDCRLYDLTDIKMSLFLNTLSQHMSEWTENANDSEAA